jgi:hypothetical protein
MGEKSVLLVLRVEQRLKFFENRVFWRIFGSKRNKVTGGWRKFYNVELHNMYLHQILLGWSNEGGWDR